MTFVKRFLTTGVVLWLFSTPSLAEWREAVIATVNGALVFQGQLDTLPPEWALVALPPVLRTSPPESSPCTVLINRALIVQEGQRLGLTFPTLEEVEKTLDAARPEAKAPSPNSACLTKSMQILYLQEDLFLNQVIEEKFSPFVRVTQEDVAEFATRQQVSWLDLSPDQQADVAAAMRDVVFIEKLNRRISRWLEEMLPRATIRTWSDACKPQTRN